MRPQQVCRADLAVSLVFFFVMSRVWSGLDSRFLLAVAMSLSIAPSTWLPVEIRSLYSNQQIKVGFLVFSTCAANMTFARPTGQVSTMDGLGGRVMGMEHARPLVAKGCPRRALLELELRTRALLGWASQMRAERQLALGLIDRPSLELEEPRRQDLCSVLCATVGPRAVVGFTYNYTRIYIITIIYIQKVLLDRRRGRLGWLAEGPSGVKQLLRGFVVKRKKNCSVESPPLPFGRLDESAREAATTAGGCGEITEESEVEVALCRKHLKSLRNFASHYIFFIRGLCAYMRRLLVCLFACR